MTTEQLQKFMNERPQLTAHSMAKETGISSRQMLYLIKGERNLTVNMINKILPVAKKYGYLDTI